jgi:hypothetical protein
MRLEESGPLSAIERLAEQMQSLNHSSAIQRLAEDSATYFL